MKAPTVVYGVIYNPRSFDSSPVPIRLFENYEDAHEHMQNLYAKQVSALHEMLRLYQCLHTMVHRQDNEEGEINAEDAYEEFRERMETIEKATEEMVDEWWDKYNSENEDSLIPIDIRDRFTLSIQEYRIY